MSNASRSVPPSAPLTDVPVTLLESFLPGFSVIRRFVIASSGFDITILVSACFLIAAALGGGSYIWGGVSRWWFRFFSCSITIESHDPLYDEVMQFVSKHAMTEVTRALTAKTRGTQWDELEPYFLRQVPTAGEFFNFEDFDSTIPPVYAPAPGASHYFSQNGRYFQFLRQQQTNDVDRYNPFAQRVEKSERIKITCFGRSSLPLKELLLEVKRASRTDKTPMTVVRHPAVQGRGGGWSTATRRPARPMSTIYLDDTVKTSLLEDASDFLLPTAPRFYARRGIPYRRGYLFYGLPGTGKTSLSFALAGVFGLKLHVLSLVEPTMNDQRLMSLFSQLPARCIVLLEDVDAAGLSRKQQGKDEKTEDREGEAGDAKTDLLETKRRALRLKAAAPSVTPDASAVTLSGLLNALDGVASQEGRILIMTTNEPENLDKALIRPGRVDQQIFFGNASKDITKNIFERMFSPDEDNDSTVAAVEDKQRALVRQMAEEFAAALPELSFTPAEVQGFLLTRRKDPRRALDDVMSWRDEMLKAKAEGRNVLVSSQG